ncbi:MAG: hypothetical protein RSA45_07905 [Hydrogenoanaerobacterium sp.]
MNLSKAFNRREQTLLIIMCLLMLFGAYFIFVQRPIEAQNAAITIAHEEADSKRILLDAKVKKLKKMKAELDSIPEGIAEMPNYDNLQQVISHLNSVMSSTLKYSINFRPVLVSKDTDIVRRYIDMNFTCPDYSSARACVLQMHDGYYRCQINNLTFNTELNGELATDDVSSIQGLPVQVSLAITYFERFKQTLVMQ